MFDFAPVKVHAAGAITHVIENGLCIDCGDTLEWFQHMGESYVMAGGKAKAKVKA